MERTVMRLKCFWEYIVVNFDLKHRHFNILQINLHKNIILKHWNELKQIRHVGDITTKTKSHFDKFLNIYFIHS